MPDAPFKVLAIDGGGIRGLIAAVILQRIEELTEKPVAELFDLVAGTSTGGILALGLTRADDGGSPRWSAEELVSLYEVEGPNIFDRSLFQKLRSVGGLEDEKYSSEPLREALATYLGDARLKDALVEVLIPAYETEQRFPFFFRRRDALANPAGRDFPIARVAEATSAAPTFFEPVNLETKGPAGWYSLVDGGVFANNPAMCALVEAKKHAPGRTVVMVSIGTGELTRTLPWVDIKDWGVREWALPDAPLLNVMFDGISDAVDHQVEHLLRNPRRDYFRFQPKLTDANDDLDDASDDNLRALKLQATRLLEERDERDKLDRLVERLK